MISYWGNNLLFLPEEVRRWIQLIALVGFIILVPIVIVDIWKNQLPERKRKYFNKITNKQK